MGTPDEGGCSVEVSMATGMRGGSESRSVICEGEGDGGCGRGERALRWGL